MKLNNKGFALTSIIYMLIVLFLLTMLLVLANLATRKVVLDKIKNDVKYNLNQGGLVAQNIYIVTFDPTLGQIDQTSKQVKYNEPYGELPTPTREGYKFIGWRGKNLAPEINENNYDTWHYEKRTTSEFKSENGEKYIRINGNASNDNIDTLWRISGKNKLAILNEGTYTISFDIRSQNAKANQYIAKFYVSNEAGYNTQGKTGIYLNNLDKENLLSSIEKNYNFDNDGEWHHFTSKVTIPYDTKDSLIAIGNDVPNLYGENSYIDIKNIQLESGDTATSYEPYFGNVTSDTIVTRGENHTLYAMWEPLYMVTFDSNGGTLTDNTKYVAYNEPYGTLPTPTKEGYSFVGWAEQYQQLEYIESTGTQYIDTGLIANQDTGFEIDFTTNNALSTSGYGSIFGARTSSQNNEYQLTTYSADNSYKGTLRYGNSKSYNAGFNNTTERQHMILKNKVYTGNSNESIQLDSTFETPVNLTIFGLNQNGTITQNGQVRLYSFKIYDGNTLVRDFVPSIRTTDDSIGLYDVQNNQFYTNSGTGSFIIPQTSKNYITDSTIVTKQENHTLYAIWEANS